VRDAIPKRSKMRARCVSTVFAPREPRPVRRTGPDAEREATACRSSDGAEDRGGAIRRIGYVPQAASLYRELSVADHLALAARFRPAFDRRAAELRLEQLDIPLEAAAAELSGGQQAQVGLAIALGTRAPVLLLDEPLASLDPLARREFLHVMVEAVHEAGATALLSSHVITDIEQACDRLLVLGGGRTLLDVSIAEGPGRPATLEEVVLGHLAAGRVRAVATSGAAGTVAA
jgi:ABC-2 type transport system ATP-binding protein